MKCAVIIPVGPGHEYLAEDSIDSVHSAFAKNPGPFSEMAVVRVDDTEGLQGRSAARNKGVIEAQAQGAQWLFFLDADDLMDPGAFGVMSDYHADFDAVWGLICELNQDEETYTVRQGQLASIERLEQVIINDPTLTLQMGHFVRAGVAAATPFNVALNCGEDFDYYLRLWTKFRCRKIATPLFLNRRGLHSTGPRSATGRQWREAVESVIRACCKTTDLVCQFNCDGESFRFRISNPFDLIQRNFLKGRFFELPELQFVREKVKKGAVVVDVGANVGNHTVFLSRFLAPRRIVVLEPNADLFDTLRFNLEVNSVSNLDTSFLGLAVGAQSRTYDICIKDLNNIGAGRLAESASGTVRSRPLDEILHDDVDLIKIDVEGMELEVLEGARRTISRSRPYLMLEAFNAHVDDVIQWCSENEYRVVRRFEYVNSVNFFLEASAGDDDR